MEVKKLKKLAEMDEPLSTQSVTIVRLDFDEADISPLMVRGVLAGFGKVGHVSVYSGVISREAYCYALVEMADQDATEAIDRLDRVRWRRGQTMMPTVASKATVRSWSPHHDWKPSKQRDDDENFE